MELFDHQRCRHGTPYRMQCPTCIAEALGEAHPERRHSCHITYLIRGAACPMPTRQDAAGCGGCMYFGGCDA